jgi:GMP synthase-like glutamine amidotransferase
MSGTMTSCLVVQHADAEPPWAISAALVRAGVRVDVRRVFAGEPPPPDPAGHDGIVVMGGPMSACSDEGFATRRDELALLDHALAGAVPTLGICLGAQLLALAAGGSVYPGADGPEIGWSMVELTPARVDDHLLAGLPEHLPVLHWHGDTFDLPPRAAHLAASDRYPNQAFQVGQAAWGLQFHLEVTPAAVDGFLGAFAADAARAPGGAPAIRRATTPSLEALSPWRDLVFDRFAALVAAGTGAAAPDGSRHRFAHISES